jgi:hypothetical protein
VPRRMKHGLGIYMVVRWHLGNEGHELWKAIMFESEVIFGHTYSHWKSFDELETLVPSRVYLRNFKKNNFF